MIATNTTNSRQGLQDQNQADEQGGLSGRPLLEMSNEVVRILASRLEGKIPIIAAGGIFSAEDAQKKLELGASLVQVYTGFIYQGPDLVRECAEVHL